MTLKEEIELIMLRWRDGYYKANQTSSNGDTQIAIQEIIDLFVKFAKEEINNKKGQAITPDLDYTD